MNATELRRQSSVNTSVESNTIYYTTARRTIQMCKKFCKFESWSVAYVRTQGAFQPRRGSGDVLSSLANLGQSQTTPPSIPFLRYVGVACVLTLFHFCHVNQCSCYSFSSSRQKCLSWWKWKTVKLNFSLAASFCDWISLLALLDHPLQSPDLAASDLTSSKHGISMKSQGEFAETWKAIHILVSDRAYVHIKKVFLTSLRNSSGLLKWNTFSR